jgi:hypothetical protein
METLFVSGESSPGQLLDGTLPAMVTDRDEPGEESKKSGGRHVSPCSLASLSLS